MPEPTTASAPPDEPSDEHLVALYATRTFALVDLLIDDPVNRVLYRALQRHLDSAGPALDAWDRLTEHQFTAPDSAPATSPESALARPALRVLAGES